MTWSPLKPRVQRCVAGLQLLNRLPGEENAWAISRVRPNKWYINAKLCPIGQRPFPELDSRIYPYTDSVVVVVATGPVESVVAWRLSSGFAGLS